MRKVENHAFLLKVNIPIEQKPEGPILSLKKKKKKKDTKAKNKKQTSARLTVFPLVPKIRLQTGAAFPFCHFTICNTDGH